MLSMLPLYLLLQILQYCTASSVDCKALIEGLDRNEHEAPKDIIENWDHCSSTFLGSTTEQGVSAFLNFMMSQLKEIMIDSYKGVTSTEMGNRSEEEIKSALFRDWKSRFNVSIEGITQDMANTEDFASKLEVEYFEMLLDLGFTPSSRSFAQVKRIREFQPPPGKGSGLPENILEYCDGLMRTDWVAPEQFKLLGSKLEKDLLCTDVEGYGIDVSLLAVISLKCFRGLIRSSVSFPAPHKWSVICPETINEWISYLEEDFQHVKPENYPSLPISVWQNVLKSSALLDLAMKNDPDLDVRLSNIINVPLSEIGHVRFAEIARQHPNVARGLFITFSSNFPADILASCGKEEVKALELKLRVIELSKKPEVIENMGTAVDDDRHFCKGMDIGTYATKTWLRMHGSDRCRSLISVPDGYDKKDLPELANEGPIWESQLSQIRNNLIPKTATIIPLITSRKEFCELMAERIDNNELENFDDYVLRAINNKCALALKSHITRSVAKMLGDFAFRLFTADDFQLKLADISSKQASHLSEGVSNELSAFAKIDVLDLLNCSDDTFYTLTDSQIDIIQKAPEYTDWIAFRRQAAQLLRDPHLQPGGLNTAFDTCHGFKSNETLGFEYKECFDVLARIIPRLEDDYRAKEMNNLLNNASLQSLWDEPLGKKALFKVMMRTSFPWNQEFVLPHDGKRYDMAKSLKAIRKSSKTLANPHSKVRHRDTVGEGPLRAWLGELLGTMKDNMIANLSDVDGSIQKFKFPIRGDDGPTAGFLTGKAMQQGLRLPFALDPKFYELIFNEKEDEIETYFKTTYADELSVFRDQNLYQRVMGDSFELTPEEVEQIGQAQLKTPEAMEEARNKAWFNRNKEDACWAPLDKLTFNGFESQTNYNLYEIPREGLGLEEWFTKCEAVYSGFEYETMKDFFEEFSAKCLQEFKTFVKGFRSGLETFLIKEIPLLENKQIVPDLLVSVINGFPMTAELLLSKIRMGAGADIDSWYGTVKPEVFFKTFLECLTPRQLSKLVAVWTGAASTELNDNQLKLFFYKPEDYHVTFDSCDASEKLCAKSRSVVIHSGDEHESFLRQFSAKLRDAVDTDKEVVDPLSNGEKCVDFHPSIGSATCFMFIKLPEQDARRTIEALVGLLNADPSDLYDAPPPRV
ncbi:hypothetical protein PSACC_03196 [Paramicrosporidium saccamoebae]|uniref:HECT domain-containing protein n=1 Tax=Paramicrosporidium saccamoebae TaxID=1246581 RepID=A0A2H9TGX2_9FUNG|nr:hypothetical protein PSACC_03196 [Paramicrosporidium saccamoebae]